MPGTGKLIFFVDNFVPSVFDAYKEADMFGVPLKTNQSGPGLYPGFFIFVKQ